MMIIEKNIIKDSFDKKETKELKTEEHKKETKKKQNSKTDKSLNVGYKTSERVALENQLLQIDRATKADSVINKSRK